MQINFAEPKLLINFATRKTLRIMGYTYFRVTDERARDVMPKATEIIKDIFKTFPEVSKSLKGSDGYNGEPFIDEEFIIFNGDAEKGEDYETFYFDVYDMDSNFCKTANRPYELAVCLCLLVLKDTLKIKHGLSWRSAFKFASDVYFMSHENDNGEIIPAGKNWVKARRLYNKYCRTHNMKIPNYSKWNIDE